MWYMTKARTNEEYCRDFVKQEVEPVAQVGQKMNSRLSS